MRTSRDLVRPLAALVVVALTFHLVSGVAAYRAAVTHTDHQPSCPSADATPHRTSSPEARGRPAGCQQSTAAARDARSRDDDRREADGDGGARQSGGQVTVVTRSGAS